MIAAVNDAPVLSGTFSLSFAKNAAATPIDPSLVVSDIDRAKLASGLMTIAGFVVGEDLLGFMAIAATMGNIVGTANNTAGTVALMSARLAQWQTAWQAITYRDINNNLTVTPRNVVFTIDDGQSVDVRSCFAFQTVVARFRL